ncbi:MAG: transposase [Acidimicrobiia bacterium]
MPRKSRYLPVGTVVHVVNRGNDKRPLFTNAREFEEFMHLISWAKAVCPVRITAYNIMGNHWHFVFWVETEWDVSAFLHRLTTVHAKRWRLANSTEGCGHVYQGRFRNATIYNERYYFNCLRYVEQNALRAGLVHRACEWRWSSLAERLGNGRGLLSPDPIGVPAGWSELVEQRLPDEEAAEIHRSLRRY